MLNFPSSTSDNSSTKIIGKKFHDQTSQILPITEDYQQIITENLLKNGTNNHSNEKYYSSERRNQIYGQKINLHHTNTATNSDKIQSRGVTRTLTPPPQRITSKSKPNNIKVEENPHRIHHKPGSTVPNLKAGSERTNRAAKWLVDEQYKV